MKTRQLLNFGSVLAGVAALSLCASPVFALSAPFTWQSNSWCPNLRGTYGYPATCGATQAGFASADATFNPTQVTTDANGYVDLTMNSTGTTSGSFNTGGQETYSASASGNSISEEIGGSGSGGGIPCSGSPTKIDNWPAYWMVTTGTWPAGGEIDVFEGLHGNATWNYHYSNASGVSSQVGGTYGTNNCTAPVTYKAVWYSGTNPRIDFYANGTHYGTVTKNCSGLPTPCTAINVPVATGPMYLINDYENDNGTESGPLVNSVSMDVESFSGTHN
jgi:hypothetical protein